MRKRFANLSLGLAVAAAALVWAPVANADLDETITFTQPAGALIMPFDVTTGHQSFHMVNRISTGIDVISTHWSFWSKDCKHLADIFICLTERDTVVVDPTALQNEVQSFGPPENVKLGGIINLSLEDGGKGVKGLLTVTAFEADTGPSGLDCDIDDVEAVLNNEIVGAWTIANKATNSAFGNDAIGLSSDGTLPDATILEQPIFIPTFNPDDLEDSEVIILTLEFSDDTGSGQFQGIEFGPIPRSTPPKVCCDVTYVDNLENEISLPDFCFNCVGFAPIADSLKSAEDPASIIPNTISIDRPGFVLLTNCESEDTDGVFTPISEGAAEGEQFLFGFHGMAVGPFGAVVKAKYSGEPF